MARIKILFPSSLQFQFHTIIPIRITDINYGGHVGNDALLSLIHEGRMQFLQHHGYSEMNLENTGLIMADAGIEFKKELFYGDQVICRVAAGDATRISFDIFYQLEKETNGISMPVALAKTGMICYDYQQKKVCGIPEAARVKLSL